MDPESLAEPIGGTGLDAGTATVAALGRGPVSRALTAAALTAFYLDADRAAQPRPARGHLGQPAGGGRGGAPATPGARAGQSRGPLDGIPVLVKDNVAVTGQPATAGSPALAAAGDGGRVLPRRAARGRGGDPRQGQPVGVGQLPVPVLQQRLEHAGRPGREPARRRPQPVRLQLRVRAWRSRPGWPRSRSAPRPTAPSCRPPRPAAWSASSPPSGLVSRTGIVPISAAQDTAGPMARTVADAAAAADRDGRPGPG